MGKAKSMWTRGVQVVRPLARQAQSRNMAIAVNQVARVVRMHVEDEAAAENMDALIKKASAAMKAEGVAGFVGVNRTVCKAEWAYEAEFVIEGLENFKAYMGSEFREKTMLPLLKEAIENSKDGNVYQGNRVYNRDF